jgi:hypothetical protein
MIAQCGLCLGKLGGVAGMFLNNKGMSGATNDTLDFLQQVREIDNLQDHVGRLRIK